MMEGVRTANKMKLLFEKIVEPNYVMNNYYADGLINKMSNCLDPEISELAGMPLVSDLLIQCLNHYDKLDNSVRVFIIRCIGIVARRELHFTKLICKDHDILRKGFMDLNTLIKNPSLKVAFMEIALAIVHHNSGINWLLETGVWKEILTLYNRKQSVFLVRQIYKFASEFLWKLNDLCDLANIKVILNFVLKPLEQNFLTLESLSSDEEEVLSTTLDPMLHTLSTIVNTKNRVGKYSILMETLIKEYNIISHLYVLMDTIHREETLACIGKLIFWFVLAKMFLKKTNDSSEKFIMDDFLELGVTYFNAIQFFAQRRYASLALEFCTACNLICWTVCKDKDKVVWLTVDGKPIVVVNQMLFMCLVPLVLFVKLGKKNSQTDVKLEAFISKILNSSCEVTTKAVFSLRTILEESDTMQLIIQSVKSLSCLKNQLSNEQANLIFQALFFVLREYDPIDDFGVAKHENSFHHYEDDQDKVLVVTYVMDTVLSLLKHHNINWCESFEVICLYSVVFNILQRPNLTIKFVVAALNVIAMTVKLFLPPNLSLLVDSQPGSPMDQLGKLIYDKMHDLAWEVRDSALELLLVVTEISFVKFPPFQKQILDNNLINVSAAIAFNDFESYVQVSALKCLGAATKVPTMWEHLKAEYPTIEDKLIFILRNNQEGVVRKEACTVLCEIYQNLKSSPQFKQNLFEHMISSALSDFHWEVQIAALRFWKLVFQSMLSDQGMLDGKFPPVTFSKELRKIVTLDVACVQKILTKILDELASIGLLTVLIKLLNDDSEVDVLEYALNLCTDMLKVLNKYKVPETLKPKPDDVESVEALMCQIKEEEDEFGMTEDFSERPTSDSVIDSILNATDINLLANIYERRMTLIPNNSDEVVKPKVKLMRYASPYLFVNFLMSKDFKAVVNEKRMWNDGIRSLSSLLDDVLGIYEVNDEVNSLDCY